jgi:hypothetical protein
MSMRNFPGFAPIGAQAPWPRKPRAAAFATLALLLATAFTGCRHAPPEQALRDAIAAMEASAEKGDADALFSHIATDFGGNEGMDRDAFRRYVLVMGLRRETVGVQLGPLDVQLFGDRASARFTAALSGGPGWLPDRAQVYEVTTGWRLEDDEWMLISATWKPQL